MCEAELVAPEAYLINLDSLFEKVRSYEPLLTDLQEDINQALYQIQTAVSSALENSTYETLKQYEIHVNSILAFDIDVREGILRINPDSMCRSLLENNLLLTTNLTGFESSNCVASYYATVSLEVANATLELSKYTNVYDDVQQTIVQSFIKQNIFTSSDEVEATLDRMYNVIKENWKMSKPEIDDLIQTLTEAITNANVDLDECHNRLVNFITPSYTTLLASIEMCISFDNTSLPNNRRGKSARLSPVFIQQMQDFYKTLPTFEINEL
ncbi:unnamed protein product [Diamesa serratosioi]